MAGEKRDVDVATNVLLNESLRTIFSERRRLIAMLEAIGSRVTGIRQKSRELHSSLIAATKSGAVSNLPQ